VRSPTRRGRAPASRRPEGKTTRSPWLRSRPWLLAGAVALAAALVDLGSFHRLEDGDSIVPVLVSLQRWTPFYWDQERYGTLVPLLALPVRDPLWNLLAQRWLMALAGLSVPLLAARHVLAGRDWVLAGLLAAAGLLATWPARWAFDFLGSQPYGLSLAVALAGLALAEPGQRWGDRRLRWALGAAVVAAAHWVNAAAGLALVPLALARAAIDLLEGAERRAVVRRAAVDLGLLAGGLAFGQLLLKLNPPRGVYAGWSYGQALPAVEWRTAIETFGRTVAWAAGPWPAWTAATAAAGFLLLSLPAMRAHRRGALLRAGALVATALAYAAGIALLRWVGENAWHPRYFAPSAALLQVAAASLLAEPIARSARLAAPAAAVALALVPVAAVAAWGAPSLAGAERDLARVAGGRTPALLEARCDLVAGDYWTVWPSVWHANVALAQRGEGRRVWGISHRCTPTVPQWRALPRERLRICVAPAEEPAALLWMDRCGVGPVHRAERRGAVDVWTAD
jgi:hypothetical protein